MLVPVTGACIRLEMAAGVCSRRKGVWSEPKPTQPGFRLLRHDPGPSYMAWEVDNPGFKNGWLHTLKERKCTIFKMPVSEPVVHLHLVLCHTPAADPRLIYHVTGSSC